jgi:hypothetical protein
MIQSDTIRAVKDVSVMDVIGQYVNLKRRGANYVGLCPFHDEHTPSFAVHPAKNMFKCFGCGAGGDAIKFVMDYERKTFVEAVELIAGITGISIERTERTERTQPKPIKRKPQPAPFDTIPLSFFNTGTPDIAANSLTALIAGIVGEDVVKDVLLEYRISLEANGFINYPQIDKADKYRTGKSIQYKDGHRTGYFKWTHDELRKKNILPTGFEQKQCFTGEHLINQSFLKPIAIVEGQSTMLFMAALGKAAIKYHIQQLQFFSTFTWIATGGVDGIGWKDQQVFKALAGKDVVLFADAGFYDQWVMDAELMQEHGIRVQVSQLLENKYKAGQLQYNEDLRDYFMPYAENIKQLCKTVTTLNIHSSDILCPPCETPTPKEYDNLLIALINVNGNYYDLLFNADGELVRPGEQAEAVQHLASFFEKNLIPLNLDNVPCWVHKYN